MATHSSILAWTIPCTEEPGRLQSMGSQRIRHDRVTITHSHSLLQETFHPGLSPVSSCGSCSGSAPHPRPPPPALSSLRVCPDQTPMLLSTQLTLLLQPFNPPANHVQDAAPGPQKENRLLCCLLPPAFPAVLDLWEPFLTPSWRREWQPTPVFLPGEPHGQRSLQGYSPQGHKELDVTTD